MLTKLPLLMEGLLATILTEIMLMVDGTIHIIQKLERKIF
jgi:hypothetical protein